MFGANRRQIKSTRKSYVVKVLVEVMNEYILSPVFLLSSMFILQINLEMHLLSTEEFN